MLNAFPALRWQRGDWSVEVFDNIKQNEPHVIVFKPGDNPPKALPWESVKKLFLQLRAEGFLDKYQGQKIWVGYPEKDGTSTATKIHFVVIDTEPTEEKPPEEENFA